MGSRVTKRTLGGGALGVNARQSVAKTAGGPPLAPACDSNRTEFRVTPPPGGKPGAYMQWLAVRKRNQELAVSDLKKGDQAEALIVRYECRDGSQRLWISPIVRPKTGGVALRDALEMGETAEGRFASLF